MFYLRFIEYLLATISVVFFVYFGFLHKENEYIHFFTEFKFMYLTNMFLVLSVLTVLLGISNRKFSNLTRLYKTSLALMLCFQFIIVAFFWIPFLINQNYFNINQDGRQGFYMLVYELPKHVFPLVMVLIEQLKVDISFSVYHLIMLFSILAVMALISELVIYHRSFFIYPAFKKFGFALRIGIYTLGVFLGFLVYFGYTLIKDQIFRAMLCKHLLDNKQHYN